ncbi:MAG: hypothetical protein ACOC0H_07820 [Thermodesulfobacteriota bacterium]
MAEGNNKKFIRNPVDFMRTHQLMISPQGIGSQSLQMGGMDIDIVPIDSQNPQFVRLENYSMRSHSRGAQPVKAFYLPAIFNNTSTLTIDNTRDFMFTADLSGCLFAAYGPNSSSLTVEHVNVRTPSAQVPIVPRATAIINGNYNFYKILSPVPIHGANTGNVKTYTANSSVIGIRSGGGWQFYYKPSISSVAQL